MALLHFISFCNNILVIVIAFITTATTWEKNKQILFSQGYYKTQVNQK